MRTLILSIALLITFISTSDAQWAWVRSVGISGFNDWQAMSVSEDGSIYVSGFSDKLGGTPPRAFVTAKYSDSGISSWSTALLTPTPSPGVPAVASDAQGNVYTLETVGGVSNDYVQLPDKSKQEYFLDFCVVSKYFSNGTLAWCKRLTFKDYSYFGVLPNGTVCIHADNILLKSFIFGEDTIKGQGVSAFIEIGTDGNLIRAQNDQDLTPQRPGITFMQWKEPGKIFIVGSLSIYAHIYRRGIIDLDAKTITYEGDSLVVGGPASAIFFWNNSGIPTYTTTVLDPLTNHLFAIMSSASYDSYLNDKDTLFHITNNQTMEGYVVELDENMRVVRKIQVTSPQILAVRDSQIVVVGMARAAGDYGFNTPDTTIKITRKSYNQDGFVVYEMDRNFKYRRHGLVEHGYQNFMELNATAIRADGSVVTSFSTSGDVYFEGMAPFHTFGSTGTTIAALGPTHPVAAVGTEAVKETASIYPNPASNAITIIQPGAFTFHLTDIVGKTISSRSATDKITYDLPQVSSGSYFIVIETATSREIRAIKKM
ncbi:MAG TPA: T9SS type A sorting domain-containing protein [Candidatus Kapabacteria bacterium]|nr:T9SS type A sorting domain-containing protein [Candidatus Kapabacteria bacterium]